MEWLFLALIPPLFWATENLIDQFMARKYFPGESILALTTGGILYALVLPVLALIIPNMIAVETHQALVLMALGVAVVIAYIPYMKALEADDASLAVPLYELSPAFVFFFAWVAFDERIGQFQYGGVILIILGAILISFDFGTKKMRKRTVLLMLTAAFLTAILDILRRWILFDINWFTATYWMSYGTFFVFAFLFATNKKKRDFVVKLLKREKAMPLVCSLTEEIMFFLSMLAYMKAMSMAPATGLVSTITSIQPVFLLILSYVAFKFKPEQFTPPSTRKEFVWRLFCILLILSGVSVIYITGGS